MTELSPTSPFARGTCTTSTPRADAQDIVEPHPPGSRVGRYVVEDAIGAGGMGVVLRAIDPTLKRAVALKLVRGAPDPTRLLREARAIAQLDHESIIEIFDAGEWDGSIFIAMEYFEGAPMNRWVDRRNPDVDAIVHMAIRLANALRSAHLAGIVHRDVKPPNVLVSETGELKVIDFGLARWTDDANLERTGGAARAMLDGVTQNDLLIGSPPYMAPEVLRGAKPSFEADAFAFGVTLYELVHRRRPFQGTDVDALHKAMQDVPSFDEGLPRPVLRAIEGLLQPRPTDRWSLAQAVRALERFATRRTRRRKLALGAATLGLIAAVAASDFGGSECSLTASAVAAPWTEATRAEIGRRWRETASYGDAAWRRLQPKFDAAFVALASARTRACAASDGPEREAALECLDRGLGILEVALQSSRRPTATLVARADEVVQRLPEPHACNDPAQRLRHPPVPHDPHERAEAAQIRAALVEVTLDRVGGRLDDARADIERLEARASALEDASVIADVAFEQGRVLSELGRHIEAEAALRRAMRESLEPNYLTLRARASVALVGELGGGQKLFEAAFEAGRQAEPLVMAAGSPQLRARFALSHAQLLLAAERFAEARQAYGRVAAAHGDYVASAEIDFGMASALISDDRGRGITLLQRALAERVREYGPTHPRVADTRLLLGVMFGYEDRLAEAFEELQAARAIRVELFGEESAAVASVDLRLGVVFVRSDDPDEARRRLESALARLEDDPDNAQFDEVFARTSLGTVYARLGRYDEAIRQHLDALALVDESVGRRHRRAGHPMLNLASTYRRRGALDDAIRWQRHAIEVNEIPHQRARMQLDLARMLAWVGRRDEAVRELDVLCSAPEDDQPYCALAEVGRAEFDLEDGHAVEGLEALLDQVHHVLVHDTDHIAAADFARARNALLQGDRARARSLGRQALQTYALGVAVRDFDQRRVASWLASLDAETRQSITASSGEGCHGTRCD